MYKSGMSGEPDASRRVRLDVWSHFLRNSRALPALCVHRSRMGVLHALRRRCSTSRGIDGGSRIAPWSEGNDEDGFEQTLEREDSSDAADDEEVESIVPIAPTIVSRRYLSLATSWMPL